MPDLTDIELTNQQLTRLAGGLDGLDGLRLKPEVFEPFTFDPETSWIIAGNSALLFDHVAAFDRAKKKLAMLYQIADRMPITKENSNRVAEFMEALALLEQHPVKVSGLQKISKAKLNVGKDPRRCQNQIPMSVLAALMPILEE